ncbi:MAG: recombinase family protein [Lachnospiraceae bacterium]|nr:recombinase family protein [Lachnospiraceae bacterium]
MSIALKNILNTMYSRDLSVKCSSALKTHAQNGEYVSSFPPYGYRKDPKDIHKLIIDPEAADTVRRIFTMAAAGTKKAEICRQLNAEGVETPTEHLRSLGFRKSYAKEKQVKLWSISSISLMLKNETYLGKCIYNKRCHPHTGSKVQLKNDRSEWIIVENTHEPIITEELFREANQKAFTNKPHTYTHTKQCALLECPYCGRAVSRNNREQIYRCHSGSHSGSEDCRKNHIAARDLETAVLASARKMADVLLGNIIVTRYQLSQSARLEDQLENYEKEKVQLSSRKLKIYDSYRSGRSTRGKYMQDLEYLKDRLAALDSQIAQTKQAIEDHSKKLSAMSESAGKLGELAALDTFDKEKLSLLIKKIYVYGPERIEILWNADDIFWKESLGEREDIAVESDKRNGMLVEELQIQSEKEVT